jgi:molybdopterin-guanine dinucleotide biosynthesis protein A
MGRPKASLEWHGSTLLHRVTGIVGRAVAGPVIVVRAPDQELPELPPGVRVVEDPAEGRGPLQGIAAGLAAVADEAELAYVSSTDVPLLHPAFVRAVVRAAAGKTVAAGDAAGAGRLLAAGNGRIGDPVDVALPVVHGYRHPLAAAYRTSLVPAVEELIAEDRMRPAFLFERCRVVELSEEDLLRDRELAEADPELATNLGREPIAIRAATLEAAATAAGVALDRHVVAALNGDQITRHPELPLAGGDEVAFLAADAGG